MRSASRKTTRSPVVAASDFHSASPLPGRFPWEGGTSGGGATSGPPPPGPPGGPPGAGGEDDADAVLAAALGVHQGVEVQHVQRGGRGGPELEPGTRVGSHAHTLGEVITGAPRGATEFTWTSPSVRPRVTPGRRR